MGLLKLAANTVSEVLGGGLSAVSGATESAMWKEYFQSGDMSNGVLMKRAEKILVDGGKNKKADDNLISAGSGIDVQEGQCMILVENGKVVEFCAEPGRYTYEESTAPSFIPGENKKFGDALRAYGKDIIAQWQAGGQRFNSQRVYFINMCELLATPIKWGCGDIAFHHTSKMAGGNIEMDISIKGNGQLTIKVGDPMKFFENIGSQYVGTDDDVLVSLNDDGIISNLKSGILDKIGAAISTLGSTEAVPYTSIGAHADEIAELINKDLSEEWAGIRGFEVVTFTINGAFVATDEDKAQIQEMQKAFNMGVNMNAANYDIQKTMAEGVRAAGENGGSSGVMGIGLGMGAIGNSGFGQMTNQNPVVAAAAPAAEPAAAGTWTCSCGAQNSGNFCTSCGSKKPEQTQGGFCPNCGTKLGGGANFCPNCGNKLS